MPSNGRAPERSSRMNFNLSGVNKLCLAHKRIARNSCGTLPNRIAPRSSQEFHSPLLHPLRRDLGKFDVVHFRKPGLPTTVAVVILLSPAVDIGDVGNDGSECPAVVLDGLRPTTGVDTNRFQKLAYCNNWRAVQASLWLELRNSSIPTRSLYGEINLFGSGCCGCPVRRAQGKSFPSACVLDFRGIFTRLTDLPV